MAGGLPGSGEAPPAFCCKSLRVEREPNYLYGSGAVRVERRKNFKPIFLMLPFGRSGFWGL